MAKLSAYGRTETYRVKKDDTTKVLMSDGKVLAKYGKHSGWKVVDSLPNEWTPQRWLEFQQGWGYHLVSK